MTEPRTVSISCGCARHVGVRFLSLPVVRRCGCCGCVYVLRDVDGGLVVAPRFDLGGACGELLDYASAGAVSAVEWTGGEWVAVPLVP
jgi:hypothetical protein